MLKELFESMQTQAAKASEAAVAAKLPVINCQVDDPANHHYWLNGSEVLIPKPTASRRHKVATVRDLAGYVAFYLAKYEPKNPLTIFVGETGATLLLDDTNRRDRVRLPFEHSTLWKFLVMCKHGKIFNQADLILALRNELAECNGVTEALTAARSLSVNTTADAHSIDQHGAQSMGNSVARKVAGNGKMLPEILNTGVAPLLLPEIMATKYPVDLLVDLNLATLQVKLTARADMIVDAWDKTQDATESAIVAALEKESIDLNKVFVFRGEVGKRKGDDSEE